MKDIVIALVVAVAVVACVSLVVVAGDRAGQRHSAVKRACIAKAHTSVEAALCTRSLT